MKRDEATWNRILIQCGVKPITAAKWSIVFAKVIAENTFSKRDDEIDDFLGQVLHESGMLERLEENLNYSADRLMAIWPKRFQTASEAMRFARKPADIANYVYGGRMGNIDAGDGFKYRGRGLVQITGRDGYRAVGKSLGIDLEAAPERMAEPEIALRASIVWWEMTIPDDIIGEIERVTKRVNGGTHGLDDRRRLTDVAFKAIR